MQGRTKSSLIIFGLNLKALQRNIYTVLFLELQNIVIRLKKIKRSEITTRHLLNRDLLGFNTPELCTCILKKLAPHESSLHALFS